MIELSGQRFGRLVVIEKVGSKPHKGVFWKCRCDCGKEVCVLGTYLRNGDTRSCGCLQKDTMRSIMLTHGESKSRLYKVWAGIKTRCYNPKSANYVYYGAKGIEMCVQWQDSFETFKKWAYKNGYDATAKAQECTLDRIDNTKAYCPENCRWVGHIKQCNNQSKNKLLEYRGETHTMAEWARILGIKYTTLRARIRRGHTLEESILKEQ